MAGWGGQAFPEHAAQTISPQTLCDVLSTLVNQVTQLPSLSDKLESYLGRLTGVHPADANTGSGQLTPSEGLTPDLQSVASLLTAEIHQLDLRIQRLGEALG